MHDRNGYLNHRPDACHLYVRAGAAIAPGAYGQSRTARQLRANTAAKNASDPDRDAFRPARWAAPDCLPTSLFQAICAARLRKMPFKR
jgi:hypothetical protein